MILPRTILLLAGLLFLGFGAWMATEPEALGRFVRFDTTDPLTLTEVRAFYGGLEIGLGLFLLGCAALGRALRPALILVALVFGLTAAARIAGIVLDRPDNRTVYAFLAVELLGAVLGLVGAFAARPRQRVG